MKKALKLMLLGLITSAMITTSSLAAEWVYVTKSGKKYHHSESRYSKIEGAEKITIEEAEEMGYLPSKAYLRYLDRLAVEDSDDE